MFDLDKYNRFVQCPSDARPTVASWFEFRFETSTDCYSKNRSSVCGVIKPLNHIFPRSTLRLSLHNQYVYGLEENCFGLFRFTGGALIGWTQMRSHLMKRVQIGLPLILGNEWFRFRNLGGHDGFQSMGFASVTSHVRHLHQKFLTRFPKANRLTNQATS